MGLTRRSEIRRQRHNTNIRYENIYTSDDMRLRVRSPAGAVA